MKSYLEFVELFRDFILICIYCRSGVSDMSRPSHLQSHPSVAVAPVQMSHPSNPQQHYKHHPETTHSFPTSSTSSFHGSSMQPAEQFHRVTGRGQVMYTNSDRRQMVVEPSVVYDESPGPATAATAHRYGHPPFAKIEDFFEAKLEPLLI